jgi:O-succinylbenzoate synthase
MNGTIDQIRAEASLMQRAGFLAVKLKVGRGAAAIDIDRVRMARAELGNAVTLRLDANRSWDLSSATTFCRQIRDCDIEYIEEPLADARDLPELCERSGIHVALDESLMNLSSDSLRSFPGLAALILKPTLLGGIARAIRYSHRASQLQLATIVSASVESSLGLAMLANLAAACGTPGAAHGLDTAKWLTQDLTHFQLRPGGGRIALADAARAARSLDLAGLTEVTYG